MTLRKVPRGWVAVRVPKQSARAYLAWIDPRGDLYWNGGPGHCPYSTHEHEVLRRYRWGRNAPREDVFYREFGPQRAPLAQEAGWLSPKGAFYPCAGWGHDEAARALSYALYLDYTKQFLFDERGWVRIMSDGYTHAPHLRIERMVIEHRYTRAQLNAIDEIIALSPETEFAQRMWRCTMYEHETAKEND
jgi:hypothetical protein